MTFSQMNLNPNITKAISMCGYQEPTAIQARCIPDILSKKDLIASAQTGTGKTASFVLPSLHLLAHQKSAKPRVLILTPTRELARQITDAVHKYGRFMQVNTVSLVGGMPYKNQLRDLSRKVDIIVATPGRLMDHMENRRLDLSGIEILVLDEADRMLDMGFIDDVKHIAKATPMNRQTLLFSATVDDKLSQIARQLLRNPVRIELAQKKTAPSQINQKIYLADSVQHKAKLLQHILKNENMYKAIIFSATKINADRLAKEIEGMGFPASALHSDLRQNVRNRTIEKLRKGKIQFLVATDIVARGIDISDITHVINYDLPKFSEDYVHRIGRVGRAGKSGIAISFVLPTDARHLKKIENYMGGERIPQEIINGLEPVKKSLNQEPGKKPRKHFSEEKRRFKPKRKSGEGFSKKFGANERFSKKSGANEGFSKRSGANEGFSKKSGANDGFSKKFGANEGFSKKSGANDGFSKKSRPNKEGFSKKPGAKFSFKNKKKKERSVNFK